MKASMFFKKNLLKSIAAVTALMAANAGFAADDKLIDSVYGEYAKGVKVQWYAPA